MFSILNKKFNKIYIAIKNIIIIYMSFTINIFNNKFKSKHQNPRNEFKKAVKNNNINRRFRVPYSGTRKTINCKPCLTGNTKVIKQFNYTNKCESDCRSGINKMKRSKDGIITDSNFRFSMLEVLERNNKTYNQNAYNFFLTESKYK